MTLHEIATKYEPLFESLHSARKNAIKQRGIDVVEYRSMLVEEEKQLVNSLEERGLQLVGVGAGRIVLEFPTSNAVIKIARYGPPPVDSGITQNQTEVQISNESGSGPPFLPLLTWDATHLWVVMPKATPIRDCSLPHQKQETLVSETMTRVAESKFHINENEVSPDNVGLWGGEAYQLDYGVHAASP